MRKKVLTLVGSVCLILVVATLPFMVACGPEEAPAEATTIINRYGDGFMEVKASGLRVLHLKGTAYERGYQRAMLEDIEYITSANITQYYSWFGGGDPEVALNVLREATEMMEPYIPYQYQQEMKGMADALQAQGSPITYDDIVLHVVGSDFSMMNLGHELTQPTQNSPLPSITRCSGCSAWGDATKDGSLIAGASSDYSDTEEELINRPIVVVDPTDGGYGYVGVVWDVFPTAAGMNEAGIAMIGIMEPADEGSESLRGVSAELLLGLILQYADSIEDAVEIVSMYPRTCGIYIHIADGKTNRAAVIEYTANHLGVRFSEPGKDVIWTGGFNCYPGWKGYEGFNMVTQDQANLADISTVEKWQDSRAAVGKGREGKYGRYEQLLNENYGEIDVEKMKEIMSDRYCVKQKKMCGPFETGCSCICSYGGYRVVFEDIDYYKIDRSGEYGTWRGTVGGYVATPATGDIWWAVGVTPCPYVLGYQHLNLFEELASTR